MDKHLDRDVMPRIASGDSAVRASYAQFMILPRGVRWLAGLGIALSHVALVGACVLISIFIYRIAPQWLFWTTLGFEAYVVALVIFMSRARKRGRTTRAEGVSVWGFDRDKSPEH